MERKNDNYKSKKQIDPEKDSEEIISRNWHFDIAINPKEWSIEDCIRKHTLDMSHYNSTWISTEFFLEAAKTYSNFSEFGVRRKLDMSFSLFSIIHGCFGLHIEPEKTDMDEYLVYGKAKMFKFSDDEKLSSLRDRKWEKANMPIIKMLDESNYIRKEYEDAEESEQMRDYYDNIREQQLREQVAESYF